MNVYNIKDFGLKEATVQDVITKVVQNSLLSTINIVNQSIINPDWFDITDRYVALDDTYIKMCVGRFLLHVFDNSCIYIQSPKNLNVEFNKIEASVYRNTDKFMPVTFGKNLVISATGEVLFSKPVHDKFIQLLLANQLDTAVRFATTILRMEA